jgi:xylulokinase
MDSVTAADYALPGVEPALPIPEPVDPLAVAGRLKPDWAGRLGLPAGLPVTAGTYDSFADIAGAGVRRPGDAGVVLGSTMIICRAAATEVEPPDGLGASAYPGEGRLLGGWTLSGGRVLDWFSERFGAGVDLAAASAEVEPGRLLAVPYLSGERTPLWDPFARGALIGLSTDTAPPHVYRALVESLALSVLDHAERLEDALGACAAWRVTGGGTGNDVWIEATADALGAPLEIAADASEAAGPALLALRMTGADPPRPSVATVEPNRERGERLRSRLPAFRELGRAARDLLAEPDNSEVAP